MKKTKISKIVSILLAVLMVCSTSIVAFAKDTQTGTITITNVTEGEKYSFYKLLDVTYSKNSDDTTNYAYTVNSDFDGFFGGLNLNGYTAGDNITSAESKIAYDYISAQATPEQIASFATEVAKYAKANGIGVADEKTAVSDADIIINDVEAGYYVMVPESINDDVLTSALFSIGTLTDAVELSNKSVYPTLTKRIVEGDRFLEKNDAAYGDIVNYQLASAVPSSMNGYTSYKYTVTDVLDADFAFNNDVAITVGAKTLVKDTDFTVNNTNNTITIDFKNFIQYNTDEFRGKDIVITYSATVGTTADLGSVGNANTATLTFSNDPRDTASTETTKEQTVITYIAGLQFTKVNAKGSAIADTDFRVEGWTVVTEKGPVVTDATMKGVAQTGNSVDVVTGADGVVSVLGLKEGTYTITETDAANGYLKLDDAIQIKITFNEQTGAFEAALVGEDEHVDALVLNNTGDNDGVAVFNIINETMSILPNTGAATTIICVGGGFLCLAIAGIAIMTGKKKKAEAAE